MWRAVEFYIIEVSSYMSGTWGLEKAAHPAGE